MPPEEYFPLIDCFLERWPAARIFVATDDPRFLLRLQRRYPDDRLRWHQGTARHQRNAFVVHGARGRALTTQVLMDALWLSKCDFLLYSASAVPEYAMYFNPALRDHSVHVQFAWAAVTAREAALWPAQYHTKHALSAAAAHATTTTNNNSNTSNTSTRIDHSTSTSNISSGSRGSRGDSSSGSGVGAAAASTSGGGLGLLNVFCVPRVFR